MKKLKIVMLHPHDLYSSKEPWTIRIIEIAKVFTKLGHTVKLIYFPLPKQERGKLRIKKITDFENIPFSRRNYMLFSNILRFREYAKWADIIHVQKCFPNAVLPALFGAFLYDKPIHYDWDDWEYAIYNYDPPSKLFGWYINTMEKTLPKLVDSMSVASYKLRQLAIKSGFNKNKIVMAPVGVDLTKFNPNLPSEDIKKKYNLKKHTILYLGQLHGAQYVELVIEAFAQILKKKKGVSLMIVGGGSNKENLIRLTEKLGIAQDVVFTGYVNSGEVPRYIAASDVAVASFEKNNITECKSPLKIVEYLASGKAIVASDVGEVSRMIGEAGLLVKPGDSDQIAEAVLKILANKKLKSSLEKKARERAAIDDLEKAFELYPEDPSPLLGKARAYRGLEEPEEALQILNWAIERVPGHAGLYNERGWLYFEDLEEYDLAISDFSMAIEIHPDGPYNYFFRGYAYQELGQVDEARSDFEKVLEITGNDPSFEEHSFVVQWLAENEQAGVTENDRQDAEFLRASGWSYFDEGNFEAAKKAFDEAIDLNPEEWSAWWGRAVVYRQYGEYETAIQDLGEAIKLAPDLGGLYIDRGWLYFQQFGDISQALSDLSKAIEVEPLESGHLFQRGLAYQLLGKVSEARADYEKYMEITAGDPDADWRSTIEQWLAENPEDPTDCVVPPSGLVGWWTGDGHPLDVSGGNLATLENGAEYGQGKVGHAFFFPAPDKDGQDSFVEAFPTTNLDDLEELTIETWVMLNSGPAFRIERFVTIAVPDSDVPKAVLRINGGPVFRGELHFYMGIDDEMIHLTTADMPETGSFHHVAGTYDGSNMFLYLDGKQVGHWVVSGDVATGDSYVYMSSGDEPLDGVLDEISIYDRALTSMELQEIFEAGSAGKCKP